MISILYADNNKDDREMMDDFFSQYPDLDLVRFSGGEMLIDYVKSVDSDLVCYLVLDVDMRDLNGIDALKQLRSLPITSKTKAMLLSYSITEAEKQDAIALNAELVSKPLTHEKVNEVGTLIVEYCYKYLAD